MPCTRLIVIATAIVVNSAGSVFAQCPAGAADQPVIASNQLEYATGQPKTLTLDTGDKIRKLGYIKSGDLAIIEGDIVLGDARQLEFQAASGPIRLHVPAAQADSGTDMHPFANALRSVVGGPQKWTDGIIPYQIDPLLPQHDIVLRAMTTWSDATPIKFVSLTPEIHSKYPNDVYFTRGDDPNACLSDYVGMNGGRQLVRLVSGCGYGEILHEIGHVVALEHEQNRSDRDSFVQLIKRNILAGYEDQFQQYLTEYMDIGPYDYDSIIHYQSTAFSCNGQSTLVATHLPPGIRLGQRDHLSQGDIEAVKSIYKK